MVVPDVFIVDQHRPRLLATTGAVRDVFGQEQGSYLWKTSLRKNGANARSVRDLVVSSLRDRPTVIVANVYAFSGTYPQRAGGFNFGLFDDVARHHDDAVFVVNTCLPFGDVDQAIESLEDRYGHPAHYVYNPSPWTCSRERDRIMRRRVREELLRIDFDF